MLDLSLFPLHTVLFPSMPLALHIFEERYQQMIARCLAESQSFGVLLIREGSEVGEPAVPFEVGTTAQIVDVEPSGEGRMNLAAVGRSRFRLLAVVRRTPYMVGRVEFEPHPPGERSQAAVAATTVRRLFGEYLEVMAAVLDAELKVTELPKDMGSLAYSVAAALQVDNRVKQRLLEARSVQDILQDEARLLPESLARLRLLAAVARERRKADDQRIGRFSRN